MSKEIYVPCQTFVKVMQCECGGEMRYEYEEVTNPTLQHPLKYKHVCNKCGKVEYYTNTYPAQFGTYEMPKIKENDNNDNA